MAMATISKLPAPSTAPPNLPSNTVTLYKDASWTSKTQYSINLDDGHRDDTRHSLSGTSMQDESTWIAFNLPVGTVVTMMEHWVTPSNGNVYNLAGCGRVVDLVGTGRTEGVDLTQCRMNDCISAWFSHTPDLSIGGVELYDDANFKGNRTVLFLSEWRASTGAETEPQRRVHSLDKWYIKDRASSARWGALEDAQMVSLFNGNDGSGSSYENIQAWSKIREVSNFKEVGFNDVISSFRWNNLPPTKEVIAPVTIDVPDTGGKPLLSSLEGTNDSSAEQKKILTLSNASEQTTTVTVTNQYTAGMELGYSISNEKPGIGGNEITKSWSFSLGFDYSRTETNEMSQTKTEAIELTYEFTVPPHSSFSASILVQLGQLPVGATYETTATRWYDKQLKGSTPDSSNGTTLYKRDERVTFHVGGSLALSSQMNVKSTPL